MQRLDHMKKPLRSLPHSLRKRKVGIGGSAKAAGLQFESEIEEKLN